MPPLTLYEINSLRKTIASEWKISNGKKISRAFQFKTFFQAIAFVNNTSKIAEQEGHHPDIHIYYNKVVIELSTHSINGLSENDFILAAKIDEITLKY